MTPAGVFFARSFVGRFPQGAGTFRDALAADS